jgi:signal transduction histidine kinase
VPEQTILIVDDEPTNIKLIKALLAKEGYHLITAASGEEVLEMVSHTIPDLILLDVMMPGIDGFEVCRRLKKNDTFKDVPVIMVTALREKEHKVEAMEVGADDFICKPLDRIELLVRVKSLLRIKSYHDDLLKSCKKISKRNNQLRELEKTKEGLTHMIVHDLNNFILTISGNLELMSFETESHQIEIIKSIAICLNSTSQVTDIVRGLLDIHKMEEGKLVLEKEEISLESLVKTIIEPLELIAKENKVNIVFPNNTRETRIQGDPELLKRVMANLLNNALRHTTSGGNIEIEISPNPQDGNIYVSVKDSGNGLAAEYHEKIFEKFEQVDLKEKGVRQGAAGIGLSFCKMAVEAHNGKIWVESKGKDQGCTFKVALPI